MMPFLQKMVSVLNKKDFHIFFLISGLFIQAWPIIVHYVPGLEIFEYFMLPLFNAYICMLLLGCYIKRYCMASKKMVGVCVVVFILMCALNVGLTYMEYIKNNGQDYTFLDNRIFLPIIVESFCLFYIVSTIHFSEKSHKWIRILGELTFGIYLVSDVIIERMSFIYKALIERGLYPMISMVIFEIMVFGFGAICIFILRKIPFMKHLI